MIGNRAAYCGDNNRGVICPDGQQEAQPRLLGRPALIGAKSCHAHAPVESQIDGETASVDSNHRPICVTVRFKRSGALQSQQNRGFSIAILTADDAC